MQYKEIKVDNIVNKITSKDTLFGGNYTIDPYQNCEYGCLYCDSSFDKTIYIKINSVKTLEKEIKNLKKGTIILGSVHDPYQKIEKEYHITRDILKIIADYGLSCHILTKSELVKRDIDLISKIENSVVTLSIVTLRKSISNIFEKNVPSPNIRLQTIKKLIDQGIKSGLAIIPILPYITDNEFINIIKSAKNKNGKYILHKHLELKGDLKKLFYDILNENYPNFIEKYNKLYKNSYMPDKNYISKINNLILKHCKNNQIINKI